MQGSRNRGLAVAALSFCSLALVAAGAGASPAAAIRPHVFTGIAFGEPCAEAPCTGGRLGSPGALAVSEAAGELYVVDRGKPSAPGSGRIVRFGADGAFLSEFAGTRANGTGTLTAGSSAVESVLTEDGQFNVGQEISAPGLPPETKVVAVGPSSLELSKPATASELASLEARQGFELPRSIAVDNSCALRKLGDPGLTQQQCEAEDPSNGDVYVVDQGQLAIDKYSAEGEYLGQITEGEGGPLSREPEGLSVDEQGQLWVYMENRTIARYTDALQNQLVPPSLRLPTSFKCCAVTAGMARDRGGDFYVLHGFAGTGAGSVAKFGPAGAMLIEELDGPGSVGVAVDRASEGPVVADPGSLAVFDSAGRLVERLGEEGGSRILGEVAGVGVNSATSTYYAADAEAGRIAVFPLAPPSAPIVEGESITQVTGSHATLAATIGPRSEPGEAPTEYRFEYGRCTSPGSCPASGYEASVPAGGGRIEADFQSHEVSADVGGLQAGSAYHFRALAANSHGEGVPGPEEEFLTSPAGRPLTLPDDRGWELVSPPRKLGGLIEPIGQSGLVQAAADGLGISYLSTAPTEAQPAGNSNGVQVLSRRHADGWSSRDIAIPHSSTTGLSVGTGLEYKFFDAELSTAAVQPFGAFIPGLSGEASESTAYLHDLSEGCAATCFRPLVTAKAGFANVPAGTEFGEEEACKPQPGHLAERIACGPEFVDATEDLRHVVLHAGAELEPGAGTGGLYEWSGGALQQVNVLPDGTPAPGAFAGLRGEFARGALSRDGSRVVWEAPGAVPALYMRDLARGETIQLDKAGPCSGCESGGGRFQAASADGSRVLFTDTNQLAQVGSAESGAKGGDLYQCTIAIVLHRLHCELRDLTPRIRRGEALERAAVQESVLGASEDGSYVYFVARGVQSEVPNERGQSAVAGEPNLYLRHGLRNIFLATLDEGDVHDWRPEESAGQPTRASPDGQWLEFMSQARLTGYDNRDVATGKPVAEVYLYSAAANRLVCASCLPSGARPVGVEYQTLSASAGGLAGASDLWEPHGLVGANVPGWANAGSNFGLRVHYQPRYLSDAGRLFFDSADAIVPQDVDGTQDVYEYEPAGVGDCRESADTFSARSGGCTALISSGQPGPESAFLDASESGDDVFFLTSAQLSGLDGDSARDVYDAHRCSDELPCIAAAQAAVSPCLGEAACKAPPTAQPSIFAAPSSALAGEAESLPGGKARPRTPAELRAQRLAKALAACKKLKRKRLRSSCRKRARRRFGAHSAKRGRLHGKPAGRR